MKFQKTSKSVALLIFFTFFSLQLMSCGGNDEEAAKSIGQIQSEEGIPVKIEKVEYKSFQQYLSFFGKLSGIKEATEGAAVGGRIEKINYKVGNVVKKGDAIVEFPLDAIALQIEQAKTAFENAEKNYLRMKALLEAGETSQANFDGVETQYLVAKRNYETQKQMMSVQAPFDGTITTILVNEGDNVKSKDPLFTVAQLDKIKTRIWASEKEIKLIKNGMTAIINYDNKDYTGRVTETALAMTPWKQAYYVDIEFANVDNKIKSGPTIDVKILTYQNNEAIVIPRNLVKEDENGTFVCVEVNGKAAIKYITNGRSNGLDYEVSSGLNLGDNLIIKGSSSLVNGTKVKVIE